ncbi:MAG: PDZ domain-containing protein [Wenzhouxiangella sp.]|jgi:C-terminal processing protease CtpA/Prc|nr:PDZ domain-containing protein [Wenzhouxiangella sp.]
MNFGNGYLKAGLIALAFCATPVLAEEQATRQLDEVQAQLEAARMEVAEAAQKLARLQRELAETEGGNRVWVLPGGENLSDGQTRTFEFDRTTVFSAFPPRLGVLLGDAESGDGNRIIGVTPGSGAEAAGLRQDDRLVSVAGQDVRDNTIQAVREVLADIEPGETVDVMIQRGEGTELVMPVEVGSAIRDITIIGRRLGSMGEEIEREVFRGLERLDNLPPFPAPPIPPRLAGLGQETDLVSNHAGLADYFGTDQGVLVLRIAADNPLELRSGDVILAIDGEAVARPVDVGRMVMMREAGEEVLLELMRAGQRVELVGTIPESSLLGSAIRAGLRNVGEPPRTPTPPPPPGTSL